MDLLCGGAYVFPVLLSTYPSIASWNIFGEVAEEKLICLKSILLLNFLEYIRTIDVLAVPGPPTSKTDLEQTLERGSPATFWIIYSARVESIVGIRS